MAVTERQQRVARRFLEVVPALLHSLGSDLRAVGEDSGPVTIQQFRALVALHRGPCSLNELAALHEVSAPAASRLISTLVERGWVRRESHPEDRRQVVLSLTSEGEKMWNLMAQRGTEHLAEMLDELTPEEVDALEQALAGLARVLAARREAAGCRRPL
jgi:DNA-binding MarR family transcriptional regulator